VAPVNLLVVKIQIVQVIIISSSSITPVSVGGACVFEDCVGAVCGGGACDFIKPKDVLKSGYCSGDGCTLHGKPHPHLQKHLTL
jgi:hypothetical protein